MAFTSEINKQFVHVFWLGIPKIEKYHTFVKISEKKNNTTPKQ